MAQSICVVCNASFESRQARAARYCSPRCKNSGGAKLRRERNAARSERACHRCRVVKSTAEFSGPSQTYCRSCQRGVQQTWRAANPERVPAYKKRSIAKAAAADPDYYRKLTLRKFGLSPTTFSALLTEQDGRCAICRTKEPGGRHGTWHVDHDHACCSGKKSCGRCIRGLLCQNCNLMLGNAKDDVDRLAAGIRYLERESRNGAGI